MVEHDRHYHEEIFFPSIYDLRFSIKVRVPRRVYTGRLIGVGSATVEIINHQMQTL